MHARRPAVTETLRFEPDDFVADLPSPGFYLASVETTRYGRSSQGNDMILVAYVLEGVAHGHERVTEYFVIAGGSPRGCAIARRRLLQLFRACGLEPGPGAEVSPADLFGHRLEVRVAHGEWDGQPRLRVTGYRRLDPARAPF
jgi:hypothetical protein